MGHSRHSRPISAKLSSQVICIFSVGVTAMYQSSPPQSRVRMKNPVTLRAV